MRRRVTFSRNLTLSLSRTCRCYCKYCAFATHQAHLYAPEEVLPSGAQPSAEAQPPGPQPLGAQPAGFAFLAKPFTLGSLVSKVRETLDS